MLADLTAGAVADAARRESAVSLSQVEALALAAPAARDVYHTLSPEGRIKVIAEVKRASPSKGLLADIPDPAALALLYERGGASAISVLTEERHFLGSLDDLRTVRQTCSIPVLRKDFIANEYQVFEARAAGADFILLIVAALEPGQLSRLYTLATELGMDVLVETHSELEIETALELGARIIGVNARDLSSFDVDRDLFARVADRIPSGTIRVAESAVRTADDVARYRNAGADVVLVGEALVRNDPVTSLQSFVGA